jgi:hypothetical protein
MILGIKKINGGNVNNNSYRNFSESFENNASLRNNGNTSGNNGQMQSISRRNGRVYHNNNTQQHYNNQNSNRKGASNVENTSIHGEEHTGPPKQFSAFYNDRKTG